MLQLEPKHWYSWDFTLSAAGSPVAQLDISSWRERGELTVQGARYKVSKQGLVSGDFRLESPAGTVATATRDGLFRRRYQITFGAKTLTLKARSTWGRAMVVLDGERAIGHVAPTGAFTRRAAADLPDTLPLPVRAFIVWLALLVWKREADAAGAVT